MKVKELIKPTEFDKKGVALVLKNAYQNVNYGKKKKVRPETVTVKDSKTGKVYGRRTIYQKVS